MLKPTQRLLTDNALYIAIFLTIAIVYLSLKPIGFAIIEVSFIDKVQHAVAYFTLSLFWLISFGKSHQIPKKEVKIVLICIFFGIVLEMLQSILTENRTASMLDIVANSIGAFSGLFIFQRLKNKIF